MGAGSDSADEAYEDDTEPLDDLPNSAVDVEGQPTGSKVGAPPPLDVTKCSSSEEDLLPSVERDTPAKRQARTLAAELEGVLEKRVVESKVQQESWPAVPAPRRKSEEEILAAIRAVEPCDTHACARVLSNARRLMWLLAMCVVVLIVRATTNLISHSTMTARWA